MARKSLMWFVCAVIVLSFNGSVAFGQQKTQVPKQNPFLKPTNSLGAEANAKSEASNPLNKGKNSQTLPLFNYTVTSSRDGNTFEREYSDGSRRYNVQSVDS
jgi:hypothetical protein